MENFLKIFLPIYFFAFIFTTFIWRVYVNAERYGTKPYFFGRTDTTR